MTLTIDFPQNKIPANIDELIALLNDADNRKVGRLANKLADAGNSGFSDGLIMAVKNAIQERNRLSGYVGNHVAAREDRILRTRDSSGRAQARKW